MDDEGEFGEEASDDDIGKQEEKQQREQTEVEKRDAEADAVLEEALKQKALEQANEAKVGGNMLFVEGQYEEALLQYELALQFAPDIASSVELCSICHSNRGTCFLKLVCCYEDTIKECKKALELNPNYMKALIRRVGAYEKLEHFEEAIAVLIYLGLAELLGIKTCTWGHSDEREESKRPEIGYTRVGAGKQM
ncbi:hypothetical protein QQ045_026945 [Rhodiola kirilowii]